MSSSGVAALELPELTQRKVEPQKAVGNEPQKDVGNKPSDHYKSRLSPLRFALRSSCLPIVRKETELLALLQRKLRHPILDSYFAWTANLASHTFYVLMLPLPIWFGGSTLSRDLICVIGYGIYITGFCKDFLCLPRPRSPPLHRITMLSYTTQEYGWPSSHSANATAVTLMLFARLFQGPVTSTTWGLALVLVVYYFSLMVGRLYCGMHGFFDILTGLLIGTSMFLVRFFWGEAWDQWLLFSHNGSYFGIFATVFLIIAFHLFLIHIYPEPVDDCPCFDDSVAFVGVLIGIDLAYFICAASNYYTLKNTFNDPLVIHYSFEESGLFGSFLRFALGATLVATWKTVLKPILFTALPPIYKFIGINLPRRNFTATAGSTTSSRQIRSQSLSNMRTQPMELQNVLKSRTDKDLVGPTDDIDAYELLDYEHSHPPEHALHVKISGVFRKRYDVEIIGRTIVYVGIGMTSVWGFGLASELVL